MSHPPVPTQGVLDTLSYVKRFAGETVLIKLGGAALQDSQLITDLCDDLALIRAVGVCLVIVHGGGPSINQELTTHGIEWEFKEGQRITTPSMMDIVEMVLCGSVNRKIVRTLNHSGVKAIGISGSDAGTLICRQADEALGQVGQIESVDATYIQTLLSTQNEAGRGAIPVIAPVGVGRDGKAYNINADWAASKLAQTLAVRKVIYLTDQDGILGANQQLISELDAGELEQLIDQGVIHGGMLAKARTMIDALRNGIEDIHILNARRPHALVEELFTDRGVGTLCRTRTRHV